MRKVRGLWQRACLCCNGRLQVTKDVPTGCLVPVQRAHPPFPLQALPRLLTLYCDFGNDLLSRKQTSSKERSAATLVSCSLHTTLHARG